MLIPCPFCGSRFHDEFTYLGDAEPARPDPDAANAEAIFVDAVYLRRNPAGVHEELWYHRSGCRSWLRVRRDTLSHEVLAATAAHTGAGAGDA